MTLIESVKYYVAQALEEDPDIDIDVIIEEVQEEHPDASEADIRTLIQAEIGN